jgi:predicted flap endonuclease-1-like 5' DNA nuclease
MTPLIAFIIGLLVGWLLEWIIDWVYWRRRRKVSKSNALKERVAAIKSESPPKEISMKEPEIKPSETIELRAKIDVLEAACQAKDEHIATLDQEIADLMSKQLMVEPDKLERIKGIGPIIANKLVAAGIDTFSKLSQLTPVQLEEIVGEEIKRLADEEEIIEQARLFAAETKDS